MTGKENVDPFEPASVDLSSDCEETLKALVGVFLEENSRVNLSGLRTEEACWHGNVLDSLAGCAIGMLNESDSLQIVDVGTGGGFPLLPLATCFPHHQFTGIDSTNKKVQAVSRIIESLRLTNIQVVSGRLETLGQQEQFRETFDVVTARALAPLNTLLEYMSPFCRPGGLVVCWKSLQIAQEIQECEHACREVRCELVNHLFYALPKDYGTRQLLIFHKQGQLSDKYPRDVGVPGKKPLQG